MKLRAIVCVCAALAIPGLPASTVTVHECVAAKPTAASYLWDFKREANTIFTSVEPVAREALDNADRLQGLAADPYISWRAQAEQLELLKGEINTIGSEICRLETIRRVVEPWQQKEIDRISTTLRLMAYNTQAAIQSGNANPEQLWLGSYRTHVNNLYNEAKSLRHSVGDAVAFTHVSKEYRDLGHKLGVRASS